MAGRSSKTSFLVFYDSPLFTDAVTHEQRGELLIAMRDFDQSGIEPDFNDPVMQVLWQSERATLARNKAKYEENSRRNAENGRKGGLAKASNRQQPLANASERWRNLANLADRDTDTDTDTGTGPGTDTGTGTDFDFDFEKEKEKAGTARPCPRCGVLSLKPIDGNGGNWACVECGYRVEA